MPVEWAWLKPQPRIELPDRGLFLKAGGGCMALLLHGLTGSPAGTEETLPITPSAAAA